MLSILEEIFLLALNDEKGTIPNSAATPLRFAMSGAILTELLLGQKIKITKNKRVVVLDDTPCGDAILDQALKTINATQPQARKISYWIKEINPKPKKLLKRLGQGLVEKGILHQEEKRYLWVIPYLVFPQRDASAKYWIKQRLRDVVLAGETAEIHSVIVLSLIQASDLLDFVFTRDEKKAARKRIAKITGDPRLGQEVNETVAEIETTVIASMILAVTH